MVKKVGPKAETAIGGKKNVHKRTKRFNRFGSDMFMRVKVRAAWKRGGPRGEERQAPARCPSLPPKPP